MFDQKKTQEEIAQVIEKYKSHEHTLQQIQGHMEVLVGEEGELEQVSMVALICATIINGFDTADERKKVMILLKGIVEVQE